MRKTLYLKLILAYIIFGLFGFVVVATFVSDMTINHLTKEKADALYREATLIANTYATDLYNTEVSLETVKTQLDALDTYLNATIWIINPSGGCGKRGGRGKFRSHHHRRLLLYSR